MNKLEVKDIRVRSKHGCMPQEEQSLGDFSVDLLFHGDFHKAIEADELVHAIDYVTVTELVLEEMDKRSKLIEHVAGRIADRCLGSYPQAQSVEVAITKHNPPVKHLGKVIIRVNRSR